MPEPEGNPEIWRYMDFPQLVSLLDKQALYFARADTLDDDYEGTLPRPTVEELREQYAGVEAKDGVDIFDDKMSLYRAVRKCHFLNCWHMNENESHAMWEVYSKQGYGIAIQSTYFRLSDSLGDIVLEELETDFIPVDEDTTTHIDISPVEYIDHQDENIEDTTYVGAVFLHKRNSYAHENELRASIPLRPELEINSEDAETLGISIEGDEKKTKIRPLDEYLETLSIELESGCYVEVDLDKLIENIYVAPNSPRYVVDAVRSVVKKYEFSPDRVCRSSLEVDPPY